MRDRTREQEWFRYNGMTPEQFGRAVGVSDETVYQLIKDRWFEWTKAAGGKRVPECMEVGKKGRARPTYKIHPNAVDRYFRVHACVKAA